MFNTRLKKNGFITTLSSLQDFVAARAISLYYGKYKNKHLCNQNNIVVCLDQLKNVFVF
jgi:hypothetical protein